MIDRALLFVRDQLNEHSARTSRDEAGTEDAFVFPEGDKLDPLTLKLGAVNMLLVNMEQDSTMRAGDPFMRRLPDGSSVPSQPAIRLNLMLLFVARFRAYEAGLAALSSLLRFLQANPVFDARAYPELDPRIERLVLELRTLPIKEQNDLWASLKLAYHPSLLFCMRMITVEGDIEAVPAAPVSEPVRRLEHAASPAA